MFARRWNAPKLGAIVRWKAMSKADEQHGGRNLPMDILLSFSHVLFSIRQ